MISPTCLCKGWKKKSFINIANIDSTFKSEHEKLGLRKKLADFYIRQLGRLIVNLCVKRGWRNSDSEYHRSFN